MSVAVSTIKLNGSSHLLFQDLSQCWLHKIRKLFSKKSDPSRCTVGSAILPLCWVRTAPEVNDKECSYASWFLPLVSESSLELSFTFCGFVQFNWHSLKFIAWRFFLWLSLAREQRYLIQKYFHIIPLVSWTLALHLFCSVRRSLNGKK